MLAAGLTVFVAVSFEHSAVLPTRASPTQTLPAFGSSPGRCSFAGVGRNNAPRAGELIAGLASRLQMNRVHYSVYAVERGGKFLKSDFRRFTLTPLEAVHFASYSRAAERAARVGGKVVRVADEPWRTLCAAADSNSGLRYAGRVAASRHRCAG